MRAKQNLILSLALGIVFFTGCETRHKVAPTAQMTDLKFQDVNQDSATLLFDVEVGNPYAVGLPLTNLHYTLNSGTNTFLLGSTDLQTTVPANSKEIVSLPAKINYANMLKALNGVRAGSKITYEAKLELSVNTPTLGIIKLPLEKEGNLVLPKIPRVKGTRSPDVVFIPTPQEVVDKMLELAEVKKDDLIYDLGCGDGRIVVTAAKNYGCKAVGFDIDPQRVKESLENVEKNNVGDLVRIEQKDIFTLDLSDANVITLYLLPSLNVKLIPQLEKLKPGSRIVSHDFDMKGVIPDKVIRLISGEGDVPHDFDMEGVIPDKVIKLTSSEGYADHTIYLWTTPLKKVKEEEKEKEPVPTQNDSSADIVQ
jgi:LEA14-like dessication related protein/predicted nuclease of predicted toxin-antitoxin system